MVKKYLTAIILTFLVFSLAACSAQATQTASKQPGNQAGTGFVASTATTAPATLPPSATPTDTPEPTATVSPTPTPATLTMLISIMCQDGPSDSAARIGYLQSGATLTVLGRDAANQYYYIQNPAVKGGYCWVWNNYVTVNGESYALPVISTATPTVTAAN